MKEKPILFSADMVRAILAGRKTQTRRILKGDPYIGGAAGIEHRADGFLDSHGRLFKYPYGRPGDELWVRETHYRIPHCKPPVSFCFYDESDQLPNIDTLHSWGLYKKYPSIFMPRWASRIQLKITDIRVEQLQDINNGEAIKEGCFFTDYGSMCYHPKPCPLPEKHEYHPIKNGWKCYETKSDTECLGTPKMGFANLWNSINTDSGKTWDDNPWVWVVEFEVIKP